MLRPPLSAILLVFVATLVLFPARSAAEPALLVVPDDSGPAASLTRALGQTSRLARTTAWRVVARARALDHLAKGREAVKVGRRAVTRLRLERAETALREALGHFAAAQQMPEACRDAHDAVRDLSFLRWQRRELDPARRWRAAAAGLARSAIDPTRYPPDFVAFWSKSDDNPAAVPITVTVKGGPTPATAPASAPTAGQVEVWVNCKAVGKAPAAAPVAGAALVALLGTRRAAGMLVEASRSELLEIALPPAGEGGMPDEDAAALLRARGAAELYWARRDGARWVVDRFSPAGGWKRPFRRIDAEPAKIETRARPPEPAPSEGAPVAGWVLAGGAACAIVAGVVSAALARSAANEIERKAEAEEVFDPADQADNRRYRAVSYATLAVGGALAVGATIYWLVRWRRRPAGRAGLRVRGPALVYGW